MKILPLSTRDVSKILESNLSYDALLAIFQKLLTSKNIWGSGWYFDEVLPCIDNLTSARIDDV